MTAFVTVLVTAFVVGLLAGWGSPAGAHADLVATDPAEGAVLDAPPEQITFEFTETVTRVPDGVQVFDAGGGPIASSSSASGAVLKVSLDQEIGSGTVVIVWRVISEDGHPVSGSLSFSVGSASASVTKPDVPTPADDVPWSLTSARWLGYIGLLLGVGVVMFTVVVLPNAPSAVRARRRLVRTARVAAPISAVVWLLALPLTALYQFGGDARSLLESTAWSTLTGTEYGVAAAVVLGLTLSVALLGDGAPGRRRALAALAAGTVAASAPAFTGHTRASSPEVLVVGADVLHLLAGSVWFGGLVALVLVLPGLAEEDTAASETLVVFSKVAAGSLVLLWLTGSMQAWRIVTSWGALLTTGYGQLLLIKLAVVLLVVAIAAWNRHALLPRVGTPARRDARRVSAGMVTRAAAAEAVLLLVVLGVTGLLVDRNPESTEGLVLGSGTSSQQVQTGMLGAYQVEATMAPLATGPNTVTVDTRDFAGEPFEGFEAPRVRLSSADLDLGEVPLSSIAPGIYAGEVVLPSAGTWQLQMSLRVTEFDNPVQTFEFVVDSE